MDKSGERIQPRSSQVNDSVREIRICEICFKSEGEVTLHCDHSFCCKHLKNYLSSKSDGKILLSEIEKRFYNLSCPLCSSQLKDEEIKQAIKSDLAHYTDLLASRTKEVADRVFKNEECSNCTRHPESILLRCGHKYCPDCLSAIIQEYQYKKAPVRCPDCIYEHIDSEVIHRFIKNTPCFNPEVCNFSVCHPERKTERGGQLLCVKCLTKPYTGKHENQICNCKLCLDCFRKIQSQNNGVCYECGNYAIKQQPPVLPALTGQECPICKIRKPPERLVQLLCRHVYCQECLASQIEVYVNEGKAKVECSECHTAINESTIASLSTPRTIGLYRKLNTRVSRNIGNCPKCSLEIVSDNNNVQCPGCQHPFCIKCLRDQHEGNCYIENLEEMLADLDEKSVAVSMCPLCRSPSEKIAGCNHVTCPNVACKIDYCFFCSCLRSPTLAHGNQYHRPQCQFYKYFLEFLDEEKKDCTECISLGKRCARPLNLLTPRRFLPGEF